MALRLTRRDEISNESGISAVSKRAVALKTLWGKLPLEKSVALALLPKTEAAIVEGFLLL